MNKGIINEWIDETDFIDGNFDYGILKKRISQAIDEEKLIFCQGCRNKHFSCESCFKFNQLKQKLLGDEK